MKLDSRFWWALSFLIVLAAAYQRITGPSYPGFP